MRGAARTPSPVAAWTAALLLALCSALAGAQERLGSYRIDPGKVSVSGISSGAFMANQVHIAHSELIMGAGLVAGGLYGCAVWRVDAEVPRLDATISRAFDRCMEARAPLDPASSFAARVASLAGAGLIDSPTALAGDKVYLFTGRADSVVDPATVVRAAELYRALGVAEGDLRLQKFLDPPVPADRGAGHAWVTDDCCQACAANASPYINDCGYDQAGAILSHIYGELSPEAETLSGAFLPFSQREFAPDGEAAVNGLAERGVVYVPETCAAGETCALHVALHGCAQSAEVLGDTFYKSIGLNEWADSNRMVVLYPQAAKLERSTLDAAFPDRIFRNAIAVNPHGCWNWWGYGYDDRFALKDGAQVGAIRGMIARIMGDDPD